MKKVMILLGVLLCVTLVWSELGGIVHADMEWTLKKELSLEAKPLDIAASLDGEWLYILVPGEVLLYSVSEDKVMNRIPIDETFDGLGYSVKDNLLLLTNSSEKKIKIVRLEIIHDISISGLPFKGPENAPVTIAVFHDYQCPYCMRLVPILRQAVDKYPEEVKLVFKHFPLAMHKFARKAAIAALAANEQGKFWEFHDKLLENFRALNDEKIQEIARELELDMDKFNADVKDPGLQELIARDMKDGQKAGIRGTPTVFVNGKLLEKRNLPGLEAAIENELKEKK